MQLFRLTTLLLSVFLSPLLSAGALLIDAETLSKQLSNDKLVLIDMSDDTQYQRFHLPGAIHLPFDILMVREKNTSLPLPQTKFLQLLGQLGISQDSTVVIYDDLGGLNAARLYWELEQVGHTDVAVLDGGLVQWILDGRKVTNQITAPRQATNYVPQQTGRRNAATLTDVTAASTTKKTLLLDVRSEEEYRGDPRNPRSGHIPGAKWWEWEQAVKFDAGFVQQSPQALNDSLAKLGIQDHQQPIITYCRSSHRATQTYFTLKRLGFENVRVYTGSMLEYEQQKSLPLTKGMSP